MSIEECKKEEGQYMEELDFPTMACSAFGSDGPRDLDQRVFILFGSFGDYIVLICTYIYVSTYHLYI